MIIESFGGGLPAEGLAWSAVERVGDGRVLLGRRVGSHGAGTWSFPGGSLEPGEAVVDCPLRELREEAGLEAARPRVVAETVDTLPDGAVWRTRFVLAEWAGDEPEMREPERCEGWGWFRWDELPEPLFRPVRSFVLLEQARP